MNPFLQSLRNRRAEIAARIECEQSRPAPDSLKLHGLKKLKLKFREQIEYLERRDRSDEAKTTPVGGRPPVKPAVVPAHS